MAYGADTYVNAFTEITKMDHDNDHVFVFDESANDDEASKRISPANLIDKIDTDEALIRAGSLVWSLVYDNGTWTRNANGVLTAADVKWSNVIKGATDGVYTGTPDATFVNKLKTVALTYPDRSVTVTFTGTWNADGTFKPTTPTVA